MAYIGKTPVIGNFVKLDSITVVNGQAAYTMQNGGVNFTSYDNVNQFLVSLNGVLQAPTDSFTVSGSTLTFASNLSTGDVIDFVLVLGNSLDIGTPSDNTVTAAKIGANAVTNAKLNNDIISGATELASDPADTDELSVADAATIKRIDYSLIKGGGITETAIWRVTSSFTGNADPITSNWERADDATAGRLGTGMTESSGVFTFPSTGIWLVTFTRNAYTNNDADRAIKANIKISSNSGSSYAYVSISFSNSLDTSVGIVHTSSTARAIIDVTNASTFRATFTANSTNTNTSTYGDTDFNLTWVEFIRLGDT